MNKIYTGYTGLTKKIILNDTKIQINPILYFNGCMNKNKYIKTTNITSNCINNIIINYEICKEPSW